MFKTKLIQNYLQEWKSLFLGSSAYFLVNNLPTHMMITQMLNVCNDNQHDTTETLIIAKYSEVPIKHYDCVTFSHPKKQKQVFPRFLSLYRNLNIIFSERLSLRNAYQLIISIIPP